MRLVIIDISQGRGAIDLPSFSQNYQKRGANLTVRVQEQGTNSLVAFEGSGTVAAFEAVFSEVRKVEALPSDLLTIDLRGLLTVEAPVLQYLFALRRSREASAQPVQFVPLETDHPVLEICRLLGLSLGISETTRSRS